MFSKILENPDLPFNEQKEVIKNVLSVNLKQNIHEVRLQFNHNYQKLKPVLLKHWKYAFRLALPLHTWQICRDLLSNKKENPASDLLYSLCEQTELSERARYLMIDLAKSYAQNAWRSLSILTIVSQNVATHVPSKDFGWFLASFVRISAAAIQSYLKLKHEPAKSNEDRIQNDLILIKQCEEWLTKSYIKLISSLKTPETNHKHTVLAAFSQIVAALLENQKAGELEGQKLRGILNECKNYLLKSYSLRQVGLFYVNMLRGKKYSHRLAKIQIPQEYTDKSTFANQGIAWLLLNISQQGNLAYSNNLKLKWLLLAFSQSLESSLPLKQTILNKIQSLFKPQSDISEFSNNYPVSLLLFNVYQYKKQKLEYFKQHFGIGKDEGNDLRLWRRLLTINIPELNVQKITFVLNQINQSSVKNSEILLLIKAIKFDFVSEELRNSISKLFVNIASNHGLLGKKTISSLIKTQKANNRNPQFCNQIAKSLDL